MTTNPYDQRSHRRGLREHYVYLVANQTGDVLYVGRSIRPEQRWKDHLRAGAAWTREAMSFRKVGPFSYKKACEREKALIQHHDPVGNFIHTSRYIHPRTVSAA